MIDLQVRIARELERGPLRREILAKRFRMVPGVEFNDALLALQSAGSIALKGLRFHQVSGAAIEHDKPEVAPPAAAQQHDQGSDMTTKQCKTCSELKPLEDFPKAAAMKDGRLNHCKTCTYARKKHKTPDAQTAAKKRGGTRSVHKEKKAKASAAAKPLSVTIAVPPVVKVLIQVLDILNALEADDRKTVIEQLGRAIAA